MAAPPASTTAWRRSAGGACRRPRPGTCSIATSICRG
jgi:hypothetical protein